MACSNHPNSSEMATISEAVRLAKSTFMFTMLKYVTSEKVPLAPSIGKFSEFVALVHDPGATDLNFHLKNFPCYDSTSTTAVRSVKTHSQGTESDIRARYTADFREAIGMRNPGKFDTAAQSLYAGRNVLPVPQEIQQARSVQEVKHYLARNVQLQVPREHVEPVKEALRTSIYREPQLYNLSPSEATPEIVEAIVQRVVPIH